MPAEPVVAVVGGGITGLAAAWYLASSDAKVILFERESRLGGKIRTQAIAGVPVDTGADSFLARVPWAAELCRAIGLGDRLVAPATGAASIWTRGRLRPLPAGLVLGVPTGLPSLVRAGLLSPGGVARAGLDLLLPRSRLGEDPSVAEVVGGRLGREVLERLVEPLLGGIHAGRADRLSLGAVAPQVAGPARSSRSLILGLRRAGPPPAEGPSGPLSGKGGPSGPLSGKGGPVFLTTERGLGALTERLAEVLRDRVELQCGTGVKAIDAVGSGLRVTLDDGSDRRADAVVLTVPAFAAAELLRAACPDAAAELEAIRHASVALVTLAYPLDAFPAGRPQGSGFLVPRRDGRLLTACSFLTTKWPELGAAVPGQVILRASTGHIDDDRPMHLSDDELEARVHLELTAALGLTRPPDEAQTHRWPRAFPQYEPGHARRVQRIEEAIARGGLAGLHLAGAAYRGLGVAACVQQGRDAAELVRAA